MKLMIGGVLGALLLSPASATEVVFRGHVMETQGHANPTCRMVFFKRSDNGAIVALRMGNYGSESNISAVALTALTTGMEVDVDYDDAVGSGCGTEPMITWIGIRVAGSW